jgi:beta-lactamase class A
MPVLRPINVKKPIVNRKLIAWVFIVTGIVSIGFWWWGRPKDTEADTSSNTNANWDILGFWKPMKITYTVEKKTLVQNVSPLQLTSKLENRLTADSGTYAIQVYRLDDNTSYGLNENLVMPAASIMKVPIMVAGYQKIEAGELKLEDVQGLFEAMGKRSDNQAPVTLIGLIGRPFIRQTLKDLGMNQSNLDQNTTTASDLSRMWQTLYKGEILNRQNLDQMFSFLQGSIFEERIPAGVGPGVKVIHKVGSDTTIWADSGIVVIDKPYVVSILNKDVTLTQAQVTVVDLSRMIYNFETSQVLPN